ncbi:COX15/CtaA family protein [Nitrososphaera sp. AFS]|uniref:COX15/CtaA family protein n=1 Tax=Nitrososphaera sp. AFS TaxID=2301191 RepID=UPI001F2849E4|nr:COX15/CtaA family protein [Nitrososphaera sp. AFS]NAL77307.1 cytochrome oxidase assembly protein [Nitrososphaera sp. AFS]
MPYSRTMLSLSFTSLALLFTTMLIGTYVDASHQGMSCPGWPLCPNGFSFPPKKYLFEEIHRIMALVTTFAIVSTAIYAAKKIEQIRTQAVAAGGVVIVQVVLGMFVVYTKLEALVVAIHLTTGVLLFGLTLITFVSYYRLSKAEL